MEQLLLNKFGYNKHKFFGLSLNSKKSIRRLQL